MMGVRFSLPAFKSITKYLYFHYLVSDKFIAALTVGLAVCMTFIALESTLNLNLGSDNVIFYVIFFIRD